jgi:hypothetical protein
MQGITYHEIKWRNDNCEYMRTWNEATVPPWNLLGETESNYEKPEPGNSATGSQIGPQSPEYKCRTPPAHRWLNFRAVHPDKRAV